MDEQKATEANAAQNSDGGNQPQGLSLLDQVREERQRVEQVTKELRAENDRKERLLAEERLGGVTAIKHEPVKEETPAEYAKRISSGKL